jgi:serine/threonine-protein kinase
VKVLRPDLAAAIGSKRFLREIEIAANLTHPHIVPLYDSGEAEGFLIIRSPPSSVSTAHAPASVGLPRPRHPA